MYNKNKERTLLFKLTKSIYLYNQQLIRWSLFKMKNVESLLLKFIISTYPYYTGGI